MGIFTYLGFKDAAHLFIGTSQNKILGTLFFIFGLVLVFMKHPIFGAFFQFGGGYPLFKQYLPKVIVFITSSVPGGRLLLSIPWVARVFFFFFYLYNIYYNILI